MDTVATLGLLGKLTQSSFTVNTASGQNMGVAGDVQVNFKIGSIGVPIPKRMLGFFTLSPYRLK